MKSRYIIYIIIGIICVVAIVGGVYYQVFIDKPEKPTVTNQEIPNQVVEEEEDLEETRKEFNELFDNTFDDQGYDTSSIIKMPGLEKEDIIYSVYTFSDKGAKYSVNINIPQFNVAGEVPKRFNETTQEIANKVGEVLFNSQSDTVYNVEYVAYLNENILSLVIRTSLKEENNAQKVEIKTYNYDIKTGEELSLNDVLETMGIDKRQVNKKIETQIEKAAKEAEELATGAAQLGQSVYQRNPDEAMYVTDHVTNFIVGLDGQIYIIYAYGNEANLYTSEMDIIKAN